MSTLPISTMVPPSAQIRHDSSSSSPVRELIMTSMPLPLVACMISDANFVVREEKIRAGGMPKVDIRNSRFSWVPTVT